MNRRILKPASDRVAHKDRFAHKFRTREEFVTRGQGNV